MRRCRRRARSAIRASSTCMTPPQRRARRLARSLVAMLVAEVLDHRRRRAPRRRRPRRRRPGARRAAR
eukprot:1476172-Prymnesium_polylepis.1